MNAYPIGNDLTVKWSLLYSDGSVFPLSNYDYELSYRTNRGNKVVTDTSVISVDENILTWTFKGDEQVVSGRYTICLKITLSGSKVVELQYDNAFMLSPLSGFKGAGSEIVLQSYCDAIDLKDAVLQARKAMDIAGSAVNTAGGAETTANEAKTIASTANNTSTEAKTIANNAKTVADQAKVTADATAATATQKAEEVAQKEAQLEAALNNLSTDQSGALALSTKVNEHGEKLSELDKIVTVERTIAIEGVLGDGIVFGNSVGNPVVFNTAYPTEWKHDSFILHPNADHSLTINKYPNGGAYQYVICDDNDIVLWLRRADSADLFGTDSTKTNVRLDIPCIDGQAKLYACHMVSVDSHASVSTFLKENRIEEIDATLEQLNNSIKEVDTRVTELENSLFANATPYTTLGKQYIYSNGEIRTLNDAFYVDVYKLGTSEKYRIKSTISIAATAAKSYAFYSSDNLSPSTLVGNVATTSLADTIDIMLEIPIGAKFLAVSKHTSADIVVATNKKSAVNIFESLHFAVDGDSITQEVSKNQWAYYCQQILGFASKSNVAFGGACWAYKKKTSIDGTRTITPQEPTDANYVGYDNAGVDLSTDEKIQKFVNNNAITHTKDYLKKVADGDLPTPDIFVYAMGTNQDVDDVSGGAKVSVDSAMSPTSIDDLGELLYSTTGAMRWCLQTIKTQFPNCRVFVSLPIQRVDSLRNYIKPKMKIIKEMAEEMGCQIIPQYYGCGITAAIESGTPTYLMDGLHPNDEGNKLMGAFAASQIKSKYFRNK